MVVGYATALGYVAERRDGRRTACTKIDKEMLLQPLWEGGCSLA